VDSDSGLPVSLIIPDVIIEAPEGGQKNFTTMKTPSENDCSALNANRKPDIGEKVVQAILILTSAILS